jgi:type IV secretion system protein VirD4
MWRVLEGGDGALDLDQVASGRYLLFVVLPFERMNTHRGWLRLLVTALADCLRRVPAREPGFAGRRHVFVDEWPRLKHLQIFQDEIAVARGSNVQYHLYCQSFGQIEETYRDGWEDFIANSLVQAFAIQDKKTSEYLSALSGTQTIENPSWSRPSGLFARGSGTQSLSLTGRAVRMPDEIRRMENAQLILTRGVHPIWADVERVYLSPRFNKGNGFTLADVVGTVGRKPHDNAELDRFAWRQVNA